MWPGLEISMIKIDKLDKYYNKGRANEVHVINETDLQFDDTGLVCILGESGSGKTTLMNTISGLDDFKSGTIDVDGEVVTKFGSDTQERIRNEKFGYIFQNYYLLMDQTVEYNIMLALSLYDVSDEDKEKRVDYVLKAVDMTRYKKRLVSQLSGGQQQRVAIARALAKTPKVIFADEPTGNLDEQNTLRIMSILKNLSKNCLVIVVTHEKSIADLFADRIINISDGKIVSDKLVEVNSSYEYSDNTNIYLGEFDKKDYSNDSIEVSTYSNSDIPKMNFKFIYTGNKIYIYPEGNINVEVLTPENEKKVFEGKKPVVELKDVEMEYELDTITSSKIPKLKFKDMWNMAKENIAVLGKKQIFLIASFIAMAILIVLTVQDVLNITNIDEKTIVSNDSHIISVEATEKTAMSDGVFEEYFEKFVEVISQREDMTIEPQVAPYITYKYDAFWQLAEITEAFSNYSVVSMDKFSEEWLLYGEMPDEYNEIIVDKRVLENYLGMKTEISNVVNNIKHFIGKELILGKGKQTFIVSGICDSGENSMYMDKFLLLSLSSSVEQLNSLATLNAVSNNAYADVALAKNEVLLSETEFTTRVEKYLKNMYPRYYSLENELIRSDRKYRKEPPTEEERQAFIEHIEEQVKLDYGMSYAEFLEYAADYSNIEFIFETGYGAEMKAVGYFSDDYGLNIIVGDDMYETINIGVVNKTKKFNLYCDNKEAALKYLEKEAYETLPGDFLQSINVVVTDAHTDAIEDYKESMKEQFGARVIVTASIFLVSMVILYFMMKSNAVSKITDIGVYRLLGISKNSIIGMFALESFMITTYTSLVTVILTTIVTKFLGNIPSLGMTVIYPWYAFVGTVIFIYLANVIIGVMPVVRLLKLPPAALAAKYDI